MSSTNHKPPDYTIFSGLILPPTSYTKISSLHHSQMPSHLSGNSSYSTVTFMLCGWVFKS